MKYDTWRPNKCRTCNKSTPVVFTSSTWFLQLWDVNSTTDDGKAVMQVPFSLPFLIYVYLILMYLLIYKTDQIPELSNLKSLHCTACKSLE